MVPGKEAIVNYLIECLSTAGADLHVIDRKVMNYQNFKMKKVEML